MNTETQASGADIARILANLKDDSLEAIDFDQLMVLLSTMQRTVRDFSTVTAELALLKKDYGGRMVGMLKAMLACRHDEDDAELSARLAGEDGELAAERMITLYARTAARFRSCFPSSFKYVTPRAGQYAGHWKEHKL